jgi:hypothetical protein
MHQAKRIVSVLRDADHHESELGVEQITQVLADRRMIVRDDDPQGSGRSGHGGSLDRKLMGLNRRRGRLTKTTLLAHRSPRQ